MAYYWWDGFYSGGAIAIVVLVVFVMSALTEILSGVPKLKRKSFKPWVGALIQAVVLAFRMGLVYLVICSVLFFNVIAFPTAVVGHGVGAYTVRYRALVEAQRESEVVPSSNLDTTPV